jgi:hypothetical protein
LLHIRYASTNTLYDCIRTAFSIDLDAGKTSHRFAFAGHRQPLYHSTATLRGPFGNVWKQTDRAWSPNVLDHDLVPRLQPSVALEVGCSESMVRLRRDAELWLTGGQVLFTLSFLLI